MSKQEKEVGNHLRLLFGNVQEQLDLGKIVPSPLYKGIIVDFYIPSVRCIVEVHGIQHHKPSGFGKDEVATMVAFSRQLDRDAKLVTACKKFNVNYEQIDYNEASDFNAVFRKFGKYLEDPEDEEV